MLNRLVAAAGTVEREELLRQLLKLLDDTRTAALILGLVSPLDPPQPVPLDMANTPDDYEGRVLRALAAYSASNRLTLGPRIPDLHAQVGGDLETLKATLVKLTRSGQIRLHPFTGAPADFKREHPEAASYGIAAAGEIKWYVQPLVSTPPAPVPPRVELPPAQPPAGQPPIQWSSNRRPGEVIVEVPIEELRQLWINNPENFVQRGNANEIGGRIDEFGKYVATGKPVDASQVLLITPGGSEAAPDHSGPVQLEVTDGRHRLNWMIENGVTTVRVRVPAAQVDLFRSRISGHRVNLIESLPADFEYPQLDRAYQELLNRGVLTADKFRQLDREEKTRKITLQGVDKDTLEIFRDQLAKSIESGDSLAQFRETVDWIDANRHELETHFRTSTKQAYLAGQEEVLASPVVGGAFPYVALSATNDGRTRPEHEALDGLIVERNSPAHRVIQRALADWGCRCSPVLYTAADVEGQKIHAKSDLPAIALKKYG